MALRACRRATHQVYSCAGNPSACQVAVTGFLNKLSQTAVLFRSAEVTGSCCAGFTAVDVLGHGTMGHVIGTGAILSLRVSDSIVACLLVVCKHFCTKVLTFSCSLQALGKI